MKNLKTQVESIRIATSVSKLELLHKCNSLSEMKEKLTGLDKVVDDAHDVLFGVVK